MQLQRPADHPEYWPSPLFSSPNPVSSILLRPCFFFIAFFFGFCPSGNVTFDSRCRVPPGPRMYKSRSSRSATSELIILWPGQILPLPDLWTNTLPSNPFLSDIVTLIRDRPIKRYFLPSLPSAFRELNTFIILDFRLMRQRIKWNINIPLSKRRLLYSKYPCSISYSRPVHITTRIAPPSTYRTRRHGHLELKPLLFQPWSRSHNLYRWEDSSDLSWLCWKCPERGNLHKL